MSPPRITLTFDNGPDPEVTPRVLDVLGNRGVTAHFFVVGQRLTTAEGKRLVTRAHNDGHLIGNHSFSHATPLGEDPRPDAVEREIIATEALLAPLVPGSRRFRPFGNGGTLGRHLLSQRAVDYLTTHGYSCVLWNSVPRDWLEPEAWAPRALVDCATRAHTVLVLHDIQSACLSLLAPFLDAVQRHGMQLVSELPGECTPILDGHIMADLGELVRS